MQNTGTYPYPSAKACILIQALVVAVADITVAAVLALTALLSNVGAVVIAAEAAGRRDQAAAEAARHERRGLVAGRNVTADVTEGGLDGGLAHLALLEVLVGDVRRDAGLHLVRPQLLLGVTHGVGVVALLGVARADGEAGAAVAGRAAAAVVVALAVAHLAAHLVAAGEAGDGVVADGGRRRGQSECDERELRFCSLEEGLQRGWF